MASHSHLNNNNSGSYAAGAYMAQGHDNPALWQGGYHLHHASAGISDYQMHPEIPEEYTITVGNLNDHGMPEQADARHQPASDSPPNGSKANGQKPRNITQV